MQELKPEDYTKVYAGTGSSLLFEKRIYKINPESPTLPDGPHYSFSDLNPTLSATFGK